MVNNKYLLKTNRKREWDKTHFDFIVPLR